MENIKINKKPGKTGPLFNKFFNNLFFQTLEHLNTCIT